MSARRTDKHVAGAAAGRGAGAASGDRAGAGAGARPRTRKSAATREKIMSAATGLMEERGSAGFMMAEVSERCGLSKGSVYYYFVDRDELVRAVTERAVDELVARVEDVVATASSAAESIFGLMGALVDAVRSGGPLALAMSGGLATSSQVATPRLARVVDILSAQIERAKGEGLVRPEVNSAVAAAAVAGTFLVFEHVGARDVDAPPEDVAREALHLLFSGIGTNLTNGDGGVLSGFSEKVSQTVHGE